jgi:SAM-dependent methyltransferase
MTNNKQRSRTEQATELYILANRIDEDGTIAIDLPEDKETPSQPVSPENLPAPSKLFMEYGESVENHLRSGKRDVETLRNVLGKLGFDPRDCTRILEFGCSNARLLRWFADISDRVELWGADIQSAKVFWAIENLSQYFNFTVCTNVPHLAFPDSHFDLVFAGSVFTHLNELHATWMLEIARITRSRGFGYLTFHDESCIEVIKVERDRNISKELYAHPQAQRILDCDFDYIAIAPKGRKYLSNVYMTQRYIERISRPFFEIVRVVPKAYGGLQTAYVFRKK